MFCPPNCSICDDATDYVAFVDSTNWGCLREFPAQRRRSPRFRKNRRSQSVTMGVLRMANHTNNGANLGFESELWRAADALRSNMDAAEYKNVVLGLIFLKYISYAVYGLKKKLAADQYADPEDRDEYLAENIFFVPEDARWAKLQQYAKSPEIGVIIDKAMAAIERAIYAAPGYLAVHGAPASVPDLARHTTLSYLLTDDDRWRLQDASGAEHVLPTTCRLRLNSTDALLEAALAGLGLAILPAYLAAPHVAAGRLQRVLPQVQPITPHGNAIYACYTPSRVRSPKVRVLLDALHARFEPLPPWERGDEMSKQPNAERAKDSQRTQKTSTQMLSKR